MATVIYLLLLVEYCLFDFMSAAVSSENLMNPELGTWSLNLRQSREVHWNNDCIPVIADNQTYYDMTITKGSLDSYWVEVDDSKQLSFDEDAIPRITLPWTFPFYGHDVYHIFPSPLGFMSMSEVPEGKRHSHFVAPLLLHFTNDSRYTSPIYVDKTDEMFVVEWREMIIRDLSGNIDPKPCQFQTLMFKNGTIMFLYRKLPDINDNPNFMIGIHGGVNLRFSGSSDVKAFVSYQGLSVSTRDLYEGTAVTFYPKSYCGLYNDSQLCESEDTSFYCKHCHFTKHCKFETDKLVHEWLFIHCSKKIPKRCDTATPEHGTRGISPSTVLILVGVVVVVVWIAATGAWCYYAYTRPTTPSGRWLIEHRPSQWMSLCLNCAKPSKGEHRDDKTKTVEMDEDGIPNDGEISPDN